MATVTRPTAGYSPTNPITNSTKYQLDSAATAPRVSISSVKVDGDLNKAFDVLSDHDNSIVDHESRIDTLEGAAEPVTSVGLSMPAEFSVANTPVTSTGTLTVTKATQNANIVFAGPGSGSAAVPTFRAIVADDLVVGTESASGILQLANAATTKTATDTTKPAAVGTLVNHPLMPKALASVADTGSVTTLTQGVNISAVAYNTGSSFYTATLSVAMADTNYSVTLTHAPSSDPGTLISPVLLTRSTGSFTYRFRRISTSGPSVIDRVGHTITVHGNLA